MFWLCHLLLASIFLVSQVNCQAIVPVLPVALSVSPSISHFQKNYVASGVQINGVATITDPNYKSSNLTYEWSNKDGSIESNQHHPNQIQYVFKEPSDNNFIMVHVRDASNGAENSAQFNFSVKAPVKVMDPAGKLFLEHGELLNVNLTYTGSPPFIYCYKFCSITDTVCNDCIPFFTTQDSYVQIVHYLHNVGEYTLLFSIGNIMNQEVKRYTIKITGAMRLKTIPYAPIVSTILAVCILMTGVALHLRFRYRTTFTETADFDFINNDEDEWHQELSFIQRVRYLLCNGNSERPNERTRLFG